ncbi:MAG: NEW3 domain-containing protein [Candidatus Bathyarchaeia archaeon]
MRIWSGTPYVAVYPGETAVFPVELAASSIASVTVSLSIRDLPGNWTYSFKVDDRKVQSVHLEAGKTVTIQLEVDVSEDSPIGTYKFSLTAYGRGEHEGYYFPVSEDLPLKVEVLPIEPTKLKITTMFPEVGAPAGSSLKYPIRIVNEGRTSDTFALKAEMPENWTAAFKTGEGLEVYRVYLDPGEAVELTVEADPPPRVKVGLYSLLVIVESSTGRGVVALPLAARISGSYEIKILNVNFYTTVTAGQRTVFQLYLRNSGDSDLSNVKLISSGEVPDGFAVTVDPSVIASLEPNAESSFSVLIETETSVNAGSYYLSFKVQSDQTETSEFSLRVDVRQQASYLTVGAILVMATVIALILVFRRFGRR